MRDALIESHIPALRRYAYALCRSAQEADDLVQDCLLRALGSWHLRRPDGNLRAWLFAILHSGFISAKRQEGRRPRPNPAEESPMEGGQEHAMFLEDVVNAMDALPDEHRAVLLLVGVEDLSYAEAARVLGVPVGTVMSRLSRGRERLRRAIEGDRPAAGSLRRVK